MLEWADTQLLICTGGPPGVSGYWPCAVREKVAPLPTSTPKEWGTVSPANAVHRCSKGRNPANWVSPRDRGRLCAYTVKVASGTGSWQSERTPQTRLWWRCEYINSEYREHSLRARARNRHYRDLAVAIPQDCGVSHCARKDLPLYAGTTILESETPSRLPTPYNPGVAWVLRGWPCGNLVLLVHRIRPISLPGRQRLGGISSGWVSTQVACERIPRLSQSRALPPKRTQVSVNILI
jgi:hypothetical protein